MRLTLRHYHWERFPILSEFMWIGKYEDSLSSTLGQNPFMERELRVLPMQHKVWPCH